MQELDQDSTPVTRLMNRERHLSVDPPDITFCNPQSIYTVFLYSIKPLF